MRRIPSISTPEDYILFCGPLLWFSLYPLYPGCQPDIDELKYPLLKVFIKNIKRLATNVDNKNRQSNIKLAIINTTIPSKAVSIVIDIERFYTLARVCAFGLQFRNKVSI